MTEVKRTSLGLIHYDHLARHIAEGADLTFRFLPTDKWTRERPEYWAEVTMHSPRQEVYQVVLARVTSRGVQLKTYRSIGAMVTFIDRFFPDTTEIRLPVVDDVVAADDDQGSQA